MSSVRGATRATQRRVIGPWSFQRPDRIIVSEDIPVESIPASTVTCGCTPPGSMVDSQSDIAAGTVDISRPERWSRSMFSTTG